MSLGGELRVFQGRAPRRTDSLVPEFTRIVRVKTRAEKFLSRAGLESTIGWRRARYFARRMIFHGVAISYN